MSAGEWVEPERALAGPSGTRPVPGGRDLDRAIRIEPIRVILIDTRCSGRTQHSFNRSESECTYIVIVVRVN